MEIRSRKLIDELGGNGMKGYLSIGKVAKQKGVSIKSLRYYDRIGVFVPAYINKETNYRYYTEDQLFLLDAIQLCIELGIPLSRFEEYKDADGSLNIQKLLFDGKDLAEKRSAICEAASTSCKIP